MTLRPLIAFFTAAMLSVTWGSAALGQGQGQGQGRDHGKGIGHIKTIHVFGDSLSDNGNLLAATGGFAPPSPPYFDGRFSNGPVWVEYLDGMLPNATLNNLAFGGAFSDFHNEYGSALPGLLTQVAGFVSGDPQINHRDLCIVWAGGNNYIFQPLVTDPSVVVADVSFAIQQLADAGCQSFLVPNMPDIGQSPFGIEFGLQDLLGLKTGAHNALLAGELDGLRDSLGVEIVLLDASMLFDRTLAGQLGFQNTTDPCLDVTGGLTGACPVDDTGYIEAVVPKILFMDGVHPTTAAHRMIASFAFGALAASQGNRLAAAR